jgi:hypothetical protein
MTQFFHVGGNEDTLFPTSKYAHHCLLCGFNKNSVHKLILLHLIGLFIKEQEFAFISVIWESTYAVEGEHDSILLLPQPEFGSELLAPYILNSIRFRSGFFFLFCIQFTCLDLDL